MAKTNIDANMRELPENTTEVFLRLGSEDTQQIPFKSPQAFSKLQREIRGRINSVLCNLDEVTETDRFVIYIMMLGEVCYYIENDKELYFLS